MRDQDEGDGVRGVNAGVSEEADDAIRVHQPGGVLVLLELGEGGWEGKGRRRGRRGEMGRKRGKQARGGQGARGWGVKEVKRPEPFFLFVFRTNERTNTCSLPVELSFACSVK